MQLSLFFLANLQYLFYLVVKKKKRKTVGGIQGYVKKHLS